MLEDSDCLGVGNDGTTRSREVLASIEAASGSGAKAEDFVHEKDIGGGEREKEINIGKGNDAGETETGGSKRAKRSPIFPTLRDLMILDDQDFDKVHNNNRPSTVPVAAERLNLEKQQDSELEAYILEKVSLLQPSFTTLLEPSAANADNKKAEEKAVSESKWKKKIEDAIAKVTRNSWSAKKQQKADPPSPDEQGILYERDVKGILNMRWEEDERKRGAMKQRRRRASSCICCLSLSIENWEFQLEEYSYAW